jgi:hypothetical protein
MSAGRGIFQIHPPTNVRIVLCNASKKMQSSKMFFGVDGLGSFDSAFGLAQDFRFAQSPRGLVCARYEKLIWEISVESHPANVML